jgi:hypothetical protein
MHLSICIGVKLYWLPNDQLLMMTNSRGDGGSKARVTDTWAIDDGHKVNTDHYIDLATDSWSNCMDVGILTNEKKKDNTMICAAALSNGLYTTHHDRLFSLRDKLYVT